MRAGLRVGRHVAFEMLPRLIGALYYWAGALAGIANGLANAALYRRRQKLNQQCHHEGLTRAAGVCRELLGSTKKFDWSPVKCARRPPYVHLLIKSQAPIGLATHKVNAQVPACVQELPVSELMEPTDAKLCAAPRVRPGSWHEPEQRPHCHVLRVLYELVGAEWNGA